MRCTINNYVSTFDNVNNLFFEYCSTKNPTNNSNNELNVLPVLKTHNLLHPINTRYAKNNCSVKNIQKDHVW